MKPGSLLIWVNAPATVHQIAGLEKQTDLSYAYDLKQPAKAFFWFATSQKELSEILQSYHSFVQKETICWIFYPKSKSKLASDLHLRHSWDLLKAYELTPCAAAAIDQDWTALRIKPERNIEKSGLSNAEIQQGHFAEYIDVTQKKVRLPEDLKEVLDRDSSVRDFYESLAYSHRKEYVIWVLSAKQEKTRRERIAKTFDKLRTGKKNPTEK